MNILLACNAGMSTSLLVTKMEDSAKEKRIECKIWAVSGDAVDENIDKADVLLLGPQIGFLLPKMKKIGDSKGVPVDIVSPTAYGLMNGEAVLEQALALKNN